MTSVAVEPSRRLVRRVRSDAISHSDLRLTADGHLSVLADHAGEILAAVTSISAV